MAEREPAAERSARTAWRAAASRAGRGTVQVACGLCGRLHPEPPGDASGSTCAACSERLRAARTTRERQP